MLKLSAFVLAASFGSWALAVAAPGPLPVINDDVTRALSEATQRRVPLFVEVWAPW
jgi:hypothetical protein